MVQIGNDILHCMCTGCMVNESTLCLVFDWVGLVKWDNVQQSRTVLYMIKKICVGYQQERIDPPSGENPAKYGQT